MLQHWIEIFYQAVTQNGCLYIYVIQWRLMLMYLLPIINVSIFLCINCVNLLRIFVCNILFFLRIVFLICSVKNCVHWDKVCLLLFIRVAILVINWLRLLAWVWIKLYNCESQLFIENFIRIFSAFIFLTCWSSAHCYPLIKLKSIIKLFFINYILFLQLKI